MVADMPWRRALCRESASCGSRQPPAAPSWSAGTAWQRPARRSLRAAWRHCLGRPMRLPQHATQPVEGSIATWRCSSPHMKSQQCRCFARAIERLRPRRAGRVYRARQSEGRQAAIKQGQREPLVLRKLAEPKHVVGASDAAERTSNHVSSRTAEPQARTQSPAQPPGGSCQTAATLKCESGPAMHAYGYRQSPWPRKSGRAR